MEPTSYQYLKVSRSEDGALVTLTLSAPATLNALSCEILGELETFLMALDTHTTRVLLLTGEGKAFVAGANIAQMQSMTREEALAYAAFGSRVFLAIERLPIPVIAVVNGYALGGGCELALACDIRVAGEKAQFGQPEVGLGIIPGFCGTYRLARLVGQGMARELIYTGKRIDAAQALRIGLVNQVVPQEALMDTALALAAAICKNAPRAVAQAKACMNAHSHLPVEAAMEIENQAFSQCFTTKDQKEGMRAFLEKRAPQFTNE